MNKIFKKMTAMILVAIMCMGIIAPTNVFATESKEAEMIFSLQKESDLKEFSLSLKSMSDKELQKVIELAQLESQYKGIGNILVLKAAWLAAAQVARNHGYPLAATLVEHSVLYRRYSETNGEFAKAIKRTSAYKRIINKTSGSDAFTKSDNKDLFYAIHKFSFTSASGSQGKRFWISDKFDFALDTSYDNLFTSIVNNWAYLNQNMWVLHPIKVSIVLDV